LQIRLESDTDTAWCNTCLIVLNWKLNQTTWEFQTGQTIFSNTGNSQGEHVKKVASEHPPKHALIFWPKNKVENSKPMEQQVFHVIAGEWSMPVEISWKRIRILYIISCLNAN